VKRPLWIAWRWWRRAVQLGVLVLFVWLFRRAESTGADNLPGGENLFFRLDPLVAAAAMIAGRCIIWLFWPAVIVLVLTLVLGRFFCGWVCPLGTLLDWFGGLVRPVAKLTNRLVGRGAAPVLRRARLTRYVLLAAALGAAVFAFPLVGFVDPFALLVRGLTFWGDPAYYKSVDEAFTWSAGRWGTGSLQKYFQRHLLPFRANAFDLARASAIILAVIFALELVARRFWCRYLCPLGAGFGLLGRFSLLRRSPVKVCKDCARCADGCRMGAIDAAAGFFPESCGVCMGCVDACPRSVAKFGFRRPRSAPTRVDLSRRGLLVTAVTGLALPAFAKGARAVGGARTDPYLLRPPGAGDERRFMDLCIRCGLCMKVCPTNVLQPAILQAGVEGMFSPRLAPRFVFEQSYCEYNCNLCGQVCPTGAIPRLSIEQKKDAAIGKAYFDHTRCLPWAERTACIRCEEVCPLPEKAIKIQNTFTVTDEKQKQETTIQQPYVDRTLCIGCGICECNCTIEGPAGIRVLRPDAPDPGTEFLSGQRVKDASSQPTTDRK